MMQRVADTGMLTTVMLILIAVFMVFAVAGIVWGARLKRQRTVAEAEEERRREAAGIDERPPESDGADAESVRDQRVAPPTADVPNTSPATASAKPDRVATPEERGETPDAAADAPAAAAPAPAPSPPPPPPPSPPPPPPPPPEPAPEPVVAAPSPLADEPIAAAAPLEASPAAEAADAPRGPDEPDPADGAITQVKGLGPKVAARLAELGITTVGELARLDQRAAENVDAQLGPFTGRMGRDRWLEQARLLAAGDRKGFEAVFGKL